MNGNTIYSLKIITEKPAAIKFKTKTYSFAVKDD